jgi:hypothetical protein
MKKEGYRRKTTLEKKTSSLVQVRLGHGSWVNLPDRSGLSGCYTGRFFNKSGPVHSLD